MPVYQIYINRKQEHDKMETKVFIPLSKRRIVISYVDKLFLQSNILSEIYNWSLACNFILTHGSILETDEPQQILALASWNNLLSHPALPNQPVLICPDLLVA